MPYDNRADNLVDSLPTDTSKAIPTGRASKRRPFLQSVSIRAFKPDDELQGRIDRALGLEDQGKKTPGSNAG